jgi:hypothetical protein
VPGRLHAKGEKQDTRLNHVRQFNHINKENRTMDETENARRSLVAEINSAPGSKEYLEAKYGKVYDTSELQDEFEALGFMAPFIVVRRRSDGVRGSLMFQHSPRLYHSFKPE